jgi:hypothetical protein
VHDIVLSHLRGLHLEWPAPDYDVETQKQRLSL